MASRWRQKSETRRLSDGDLEEAIQLNETYVLTGRRVYLILYRRAVRLH